MILRQNPIVLKNAKFSNLVLPKTLDAALFFAQTIWPKIEDFQLTKCLENNSYLTI